MINFLLGLVVGANLGMFIMIAIALASSNDK